MSDLSIKQQQILDYLKSEVKERGYPPSVREICDAIGLKSTSTVHGHLTRLERKGYIRRDPSKPRAIEILDDEPVFSEDQEVVDVPIIGTITAGMPILAVENIDGTFPIPVQYITGESMFMLKVRGESMINAGIFDKDLILVKQQRMADNGDIVVALIDDDYATVKRFYMENGHIRLQPENPSMSPIIVEKCTVLGIVTGLFRKF
ncbi:transcriptional repressor LexA [Lachnospiraceae bacterium NSJ-143]|nr:transcriptional repressor LexA [Lachnospiraceae bacterium NSJ-143]